MVIYFRKVKQTWTKIKKKTLELKRLGFHINSICRVEATKITLVSGNASDEKNLHSSGRKLLFF